MARDETQQWKTRPTLGELCDRLTILSLRRVKSVDADRVALHRAISDVVDDAANYLGTEQARILQEVCFLSALNAQIWHLKDEMTDLSPESDEYSSRLITAHQLNGYRNQAKNSLSGAAGAAAASQLSNTMTDGLEI